MGYPECHARLNCLSPYYSEIAFRNYLIVKQKYLLYKNDDLNTDIFCESHLINEHKMIAVVFAQMAIESFFNDYAATCLGDDEFYDNFDKLDILGKFQLITKFILKDNLDKGCEPYNSLKSLIKLRNSYIHNKSVEYKSANINNSIDDDEINDIPLDVMYKSELKSYKNMLQVAETAIKAIAKVTKYFDARDEHVSAKFNFFGFISNPIGLNINDIQKEIKNFGITYEIQI